MPGRNETGLSHPLIDYGSEEQRKDQRDLAARKWAMPLLAPKPQKSCDVGLFSDDRDQLDMIEMTRKTAT